MDYTSDEVSLVVLNYNDSDTVINYIESVKKYEIFQHIIVVDNCSTDNSFNQLCSLSSSKIDVIRTDYNGGYGYGNNYGIRYVIEKYKSAYILISNPDVEYTNETVKKLLSCIKTDDSIGVVAPVMKTTDGEICDYCAWYIPNGWNYVLRSVPLLNRIVKSTKIGLDEISNNEMCSVGAVAGSLLLVRSSAMDAAGMYDEDIFLYCEENVLGIKMKEAGYTTKLLTKAYFIHHHSVSINKSISSRIVQTKIMWESKLIVLKKYYHFNKVSCFFALILSRISILLMRIMQIWREN